MTLAAAIGACSVLCALLIAFIGAVWRLGSRVGELQSLVINAGVNLRDVTTACKELHEAFDEQQKQIQWLRAQWETLHLVIERVNQHETRLGRIEAVCAERRGTSGVFHRDSLSHEDDAIPEGEKCPLGESNER